MRRSEMRHSPTQLVTWVDLAAHVLAREDVTLNVRPALLGRLERFGLAITGEPLLELKPEGT